LFFEKKKVVTPIGKNSVNELKLDIDQSIKNYLAFLNSNKLLKNSELSNISDDVIQDAVIIWMNNKIEKDWSNQHKIIESLPKPCQDIYACVIVANEINNGGFNQLFFNSAGQFAYMAQNGFFNLGLIKMSQIMEQAIEIYNRSKIILEKYKDETVESFSDSYTENLFNQVDDEFNEECEKCNLYDVCIQYIRSNSDCFGD
jgi:hypothetical protein